MKKFKFLSASRLVLVASLLFWTMPACEPPPPHELCDITGVYGQPEIKCVTSDSYALIVYFTGVYINERGRLEKVVVDHETVVKNHPYNYVGEIDGKQVYKFGLWLPNKGRTNVEVFFAIKDGHCTWTAPNLYDEPDCTG
ncbi:MAG: hypothetical protein D6730_24100 [Bacteroidetes bacterium]|nr:MAG: hypothetical protein D6730_24100 [Bacteroidota bacterium]